MQLLYEYPTWEEQCTGENAHPEFEELKSIIRYVRAVQGWGKCIWPALEPQGVRRKWPALAPVDGDWLDLFCPSAAYAYFFDRFSGHPSSSFPWSGEDGLLKHISFDPFRPLGFVFWSQERMNGYGLMPPTHPNPISSPVKHWNTYHFAWQSILSAEQRADYRKRKAARKRAQGAGLFDPMRVEWDRELEAGYRV